MSAASQSVRIPFNCPAPFGRESALLQEALAGGHYAGDGPFTRRCSQHLERLLGCAKVLLTTSCTHALEMAGLLLNLQAGDEVILPSFTFVSTANAFVLRGAKPVFADIRSDTLNLDERLLPALLTPRTRVIVPVHYAGVGCEMDVILALASRYGLAVVEDNAHGLFGKYRGRALGTLGGLATQSFHETKNLTCGEGGALVVNDARHLERAEVLREKGTNRSRFFRGQVDKYSWVDLGSSYLLSDLLAAILWGQLEQSEAIQAHRRLRWESYDQALKDWAIEQGVQRPFVPTHCEQSWHMYYLVLPSHAAQMSLIAFLKARGVQSVFHYLPLHSSEMGLRLGARLGECPVTEDLSARLVRLPFHNRLDAETQARVIDAVCAWRPGC